MYFIILLRMISYKLISQSILNLKSVTFYSYSTLAPLIQAISMLNITFVTVTVLI